MSAMAMMLAGGIAMTRMRVVAPTMPGMVMPMAGIEMPIVMSMPAPRAIDVAAIIAVWAVFSVAQPEADVISPFAETALIVTVVLEIFRKRLRQCGPFCGERRVICALTLGVPTVQPLLDLAHAITVIDLLFFLIVFFVLVGCRRRV